MSPAPPSRVVITPKGIDPKRYPAATMAKRIG
jgi:hypothetical protein